LNKLRIVVADDNSLLLQHLVQILAVEFAVVATATDGQSALELIRRFQPDVVVLDLRMPKLNGLEITKELGGHLPCPGIVICSLERDPDIVRAAREAGAVGYVFKTRLNKDLILAVKSAAQSKPFLSPAPH